MTNLYTGLTSMVHLTGSVSGSVEVMNLIMIDYFAFLLESFTYVAQKNAQSFWYLYNYFAQILLTKLVMPNADT